jgi:L-lactate dehydrogenase complex protein LldG
VSGGSREAILGRIRAATAGAEAPPTPREYRSRGELDLEARVELFRNRVDAYRAEARRVPAESARAAVEEALQAGGAARVGIPPGLPAGWRPEGVELVLDTGLTPDELDGLHGVVTGCTVAVAETGTLVLAGGPAEGRRALTLVPDLHVCIVEEKQIVELLPEATEQLAELVRRERRALTYISGPSATSDIELSRVEGVHGPRRLVVLVLHTRAHAS